MITQKTTILNGRYRIDKTLGQGGMGTVFLVHDLLYNRDVALKQIKVDKINRTYVQQFKNEFEIMTQLKHPNLVQVFDLGYDKEQEYYFITMEYCAGVSIRELLHKNGKVHEPLLVPLIEAIGRGLGFIHSRGIIHQDISLGNLVLCNDNNLKIMDLGVASLAQSNDTQQLKGTLGYLAPEILLRNEISVQSDMFAFGVSLFEMMSGSEFFHEYTSQEVINCLKNKEQFNGLLHKHEVNFHSRLWPLIQTMVAYEKNERPTNCADILTRLDTLVESKILLETKETKEAFVLGVQCVGRESEQKTIFDFIKNQQTKKDYCFILGEAGVGKSRLMYEVKKKCQVETIAFYEGNCYRDVYTAFSPFVQIISEMIYTAPSELIETYGPFIKNIIPEHRHFETINARPSSDPQNERNQIMKACVDFILDFISFHKTPTLIYCNDMQWGDDGSCDLVNKLILKIKKASNSVHSLSSILISSRLEGESKLLNIISDLAQGEILRLQPFNKKIVQEYMEKMFGQDMLHSSIQNSYEAIHARVGGNPFFLQEFIRLLIQQQILNREQITWQLNQKIDRISLPTEIGEIVLSRLQGLNLNSDTFKLIEIFALLNRSITIDELQCIISCKQSQISELLHFEIVREESISSHVYYKLTHDLIRATVIKQIQQCDRIHLHIAHALEKFHNDNLALYTAELAYHYYQGHNDQKALVYVGDALQTTKKKFDNSKALFYADCLIEMYQRADNIVKVIDTAMVKIEIFTLMNKFDSALDIISESIAESEQINSDTHLADLYYKKILILKEINAEIDEMDKAAHNSIQYYVKTNNQSGIANNYNTLGYYYTGVRCDLDKALDYLEKSLAINQEIKDIENAAYNMGNISFIFLKRGDYEKALDYNKKAISILEGEEYRQKCKNSYAAGYSFVARAYYELKQWENALINWDLSIKNYQEVGNLQYVALGYIRKAEIYAEQRLAHKSQEQLNAVQEILQEIESHVVIKLIKKNYAFVEYKLTGVQGTYDIAIKKFNELLSQETDITAKADIAYELWLLEQNEANKTQAIHLFNTILESEFIASIQAKHDALSSDSVVNDYYHVNDEVNEISPFTLPEDTASDIVEYFDELSDIENEIRNDISKKCQRFIDQQVKNKFVELNKHLYKKERDQKRTLFSITDQNSIFYDIMHIVRDINSNLSLDDLFIRIVDACIHLFKANRGAIFLYGSDEKLNLKVARNWDTQNLFSFNPSQTVMNRVITTNKAMFMSDLLEDGELSKTESILNMELRSVMCAPLTKTFQDNNNNNKISCMGLLYLDSKNKSHTNSLRGDLIEIFNVLTDQAAVALQNAQLNENLKELNDTLEEKVHQRTQDLEKAQKSLVKEAYKTGMADIASEVIHNIGNVLTSVMTSSQLIDRILQKSNIEQFQKANILLKDNIHDIKTFVFENPKGEKLLHYYLLLGDQLKKEKETLQFHSERLELNTKKIQQIISTQQDFTDTKELLQPLDLVQTIEEGLNILKVSLTQNKIRVIKNFNELPMVYAHRFKCIHILINIVKNAIEALANKEEDENLITINVFEKEDWIVATFTDNGIGIKPEDHHKIFTHGYTTKRDRQGYNLHICANYLHEMKGQISFFSKGLNQGTCFTIKLLGQKNKDNTLPLLI